MLRPLRHAAALLAVVAPACIAAPLDDALRAYEGGDYVHSVPLIREWADAGDARAQYNLGAMYFAGRGVDHDEGRAILWFRKAAEQDYAPAETTIGELYAAGRIDGQDDAKAVSWYRKAVAQHDANATYDLAGMYQDGRGVAKDENEALRLYRQAAEQGEARSQVRIGDAYRFGKGVEGDYTQALAWYRKAAEQGNADAALRIGLMYRDGQGVLTDDAQAVSWFRKAIERGSVQGNAMLGWMYEHGRGVPVDDAEAARLYGAGAERGDAYAKSQLAALDARRRDTFDAEGKVADAEAAVSREAQRAAVDPERAALVKEIALAARFRERLERREVQMPNDPPQGTAKVPAVYLRMIRATARASFRPAMVEDAFERRLAAAADADTLRAGLAWERSGIGQRATQLLLAWSTEENRAAALELARMAAGATPLPDDERARGCAEIDVLTDQSRSLLPIFEAPAAGIAIALAAEHGQAMDRGQLQSALALIHGALMERVRRSVALSCLFLYKPLGDAEFGEIVAFARSESGGRYQRAVMRALREALLERSEVFVRAFVRIAHEVHEHPHA